MTSDPVSSHPPTQIVTPSSINAAPIANNISPDSGLPNNSVADFGQGVTEENYTNASPINPFKSNQPQTNPFQSNPNPFQSNPNPFR